MLEMREREGSDVLGAREDRGKGGREASKHSAEVGIPRRRRSQEVSWCSAESRRRSEALTRALGRRPVLAEFNCMRGWPPRNSARERTRGWDTRGLTANNDHTGSGPRRREDRTAFCERTVVNKQNTKSFHDARRSRTHEHSQHAGDSGTACSTAQMRYDCSSVGCRESIRQAMVDETWAAQSQ